MISLLDRTLEELEREVRDLKTIHTIGPGTTRFYGGTAEVVGPGTKRLRIVIAEGEPIPPMMTATSDNGQQQRVFVDEPENRTYTVTMFSIDEGRTIHWRIVSSSMIESIEVVDV